MYRVTRGNFAGVQWFYSGLQWLNHSLTTEHFSLSFLLSPPIPIFFIVRTVCGKCCLFSLFSQYDSAWWLPLIGFSWIRVPCALSSVCFLWAPPSFLYIICLTNPWWNSFKCFVYMCDLLITQSAFIVFVSFVFNYPIVLHCTKYDLMYYKSLVNLNWFTGSDFRKILLPKSNRERRTLGRDSSTEVYMRIGNKCNVSSFQKLKMVQFSKTIKFTWNHHQYLLVISTF